MPNPSRYSSYRFRTAACALGLTAAIVFGRATAGPPRIDADTLARYERAVARGLADRYPRSFRDRAAFEAHRRQFVERMKLALGWDVYRRQWPLNAQVVGQVDRGDYLIEKVIFESVPGLRGPVLIYRPGRIEEPLPAVINPYGHWADDKWEPPVQARCIALAKLGFIALVYDPLCQGERSWLGRGHERHRPRMQLAGHTMLGLMFWETSRAIDYLVTRQDVDARRIGCTGASGGGLNTVYTAMLDDRIAVAAPCVYATNLAALVQRGNAGCCAYVPNHALIGEVDDVHAMVAPRKLLILGAKNDLELCTMQSQIAENAARTYRLYGDTFLSSFSDPVSKHDYSLAMRERLYAWCARWLKDDDEVGDTLSEPADVSAEIVPKDDPRLIVFVNEGQRGDTLAEIDRRIAAARRERWLPPPAESDGVPAYREGLAAQLRTLFGDFPRTPAPARSIQQRAREGEDHVIVEIILETEPSLPISITRYRDPDAPASSVLLMLDFDADHDARADGQACQASRAGLDVYRILPRGTGRARPEKEDADLFAMALAKPTMAGQVHDVRSVRRYIEEKVYVGKETSFALAARGERACSVASVCGLLDEWSRIDLTGALPSWQRYLDLELRPAYAAALPMQLKVCDLPQIWSALAPTPLTVRDPVDANGRPAPTDVVLAELRPVRKLYELTGQANRFTIARSPVTDPAPSKN